MVSNIKLIIFYIKCYVNVVFLKLLIINNYELIINICRLSKKILSYLKSGFNKYF